MVAAKTNERPGTRARASYVRCSAYKVREVLDLIRGLGCTEAQDVLTFCERDAARPISKLLQSALANAAHNDGLDSDDLYVSVCYADEGPTLKRWRPRARGRATRIRKRTCHITVIVSLYDAETLEQIRAAESRLSAGTSEARRRRVEQSRAAAQARRADRQDGAAAADADAEQDSEADAAAKAASVVEATEAALSESQESESQESESQESETAAGGAEVAAAGDEVAEADGAGEIVNAGEGGDADKDKQESGEETEKPDGSV